MKIDIEHFASGWIGASIGVNEKEIDQLISKLTLLRGGEIGNFHIRAEDFDAKPNIADIEFSMISISARTHTID